MWYVGYLYLDDEHTLSHESGVFSLRLLSFSSGNAGVSVLRCTTAQSFIQADAIAAATDKDGEYMASSRRKLRDLFV